MSLYGNLLSRSDGMLSPQVRFQIALNNPIVQRCAEISQLIEEGSIKDLQVIFPQLVENIFGFNNHPGWDLKTISRITQPRDYDSLRHFLGPEGPLMKLVYKLMSDSCIRYEFPVSCLPLPTRRVLEEGVIPMLYINKLQISAHGRLPTTLSLHAFEFYIFHLAFCLVNPYNQKNYANWTVPAEAVYPSVIDDYLQYFLPADGSSVPAVYLSAASRATLPPSPVYNSNLSTYNSSYTPQPTPSRNSRLLKNRNVGKSPATSPPLPEPSHAEIWRTETIVQVFIEIWLTYSSVESNNLGFISSTQAHPLSYGSSPFGARYSGLFQTDTRWMVDHPINSVNPLCFTDTFFPNFDHVRIVRMLVKHLHYFSNNHVAGSLNPLDELKRTVIPHFLQKKLYSFLQYSIAHWPLDASFRLIMETWLSYIQPWRYMVLKSARTHNPESSEEKDRSVNIIWNKFITENLAFYTIIFQRTLPRFFRMDLSTPKNAYMLYRVTKVYSQPNLHEMISEAEYSMQEPSQRISRLAATPHTFMSSDSPSLSAAVVSSGTSAIIRQQLLELERPGYQYTPLFGDEVRAQIHQLLLLITQARQVAQTMLNAPENGTSGFLSQLKRTILSLFDANTYPQGSDEYTPLDNRKVDVHLEIASNHLCNLFHLQMPIMQQNGIVSSNISEASSSTSSSRTLKSLQSHSKDDSIMELQKKYGNKQMEITFRGNPDLQPIRSYEIAIFVRWLYHLSSYLNNKYRLQLRNLYHRRNFVGYFCKQFLEKPIIYYEFNKDVYPPMRQQNVLPPRFSFRFMAHKQRLSYLLGLFLVAYSWGYNPLIAFILLLGCILMYTTIKAVFLSVYNYRES